MKLKIEVNENGCTVCHDGPNGDVVVKAVDVNDLSRALAGDIIVDTGWLGPRIHRFSQMGGVTRVLVESPPAKRTILFNDERGRHEAEPIENVACPRCLFNFSIRQGMLEGSRVVVCAEAVPPGMEWIPSDQTPVARFPFPNVFQDTRICWGHVVLPTFTMQTIGGLANLFWSAPFNHDLDQMGLPNMWHGDPTPHGKALFRALAREATYPMDLLTRFGTLGNWWAGDIH